MNCKWGTPNGNFTNYLSDSESDSEDSNEEENKQNITTSEIIDGSLDELNTNSSHFSSIHIHGVFHLKIEGNSKYKKISATYFDEALEKVPNLDNVSVITISKLFIDLQLAKKIQSLISKTFSIKMELYLCRVEKDAFEKGINELSTIKYIIFDYTELEEGDLKHFFGLMAERIEFVDILWKNDTFPDPFILNYFSSMGKFTTLKRLNLKGRNFKDIFNLSEKIIQLNVENLTLNWDNSIENFLRVLGNNSKQLKLKRITFREYRSNVKVPLDLLENLRVLSNLESIDFSFTDISNLTEVECCISEISSKITVFYKKL